MSDEEIIQEDEITDEVLETELEDELEVESADESEGELEDAEDEEAYGNAAAGEVSEEEEHSYNIKTEELSEEELDTVADAALETLRMILAPFGFAEAEIDEYEGDEGELIFDIVGDNLAVLIGRHGRTLDALQFIVSAAVTKKVGFRYPIVVDIEGYKNRQKQKLISLAKSSAARAIRLKREVRLRPMTPYERRIIHVCLKDDRRVTTSSEGAEPNRQVVVYPV